MKAIILAAGMGSRLGDITRERPKILTELSDGVTILDLLLSGLRSVGVDEVIVVVGYRADVVTHHVAALSSDAVPRVRLVHNERFQDSGPFYSLFLGWNELRPEDDFLVLNGDTLFSDDFYRDFSAHLQRGSETMGLVGSYREEFEDDDVKIVLEETCIVKVGKRVSVEEATARSAGVFVCMGTDSRKIFREFLLRHSRNIDLLAKGATWHGFLDSVLVAERRLAFFAVPAVTWHEIDNPSDLMEAKLRYVKPAI